MGVRILAAAIVLGTMGPASVAAADVVPLMQLTSDKGVIVAGWESAALMQISLTIAGIVFGGIITLLQPWGSSKWSRVAAGVLGLATATVTGLISKAPVSYSTYEKSALRARAKISIL